MAIIAVRDIFVSHFAAGGRLDLVVTGRRLRRVLVSGLLFLQLPLAGAATQTEALALLNQKVQARSALLVDAASGRVLFSRNPTEGLPPASTVKLLTALLVYERTQLKGEVVIENADTLVEPSRIPLKPGRPSGQNPGAIPAHRLGQRFRAGAGAAHGWLGGKVCGDNERPRP